MARNANALQDANKLATSDGIDKNNNKNNDNESNSVDMKKVDLRGNYKGENSNDILNKDKSNDLMK